MFRKCSSRKSAQMSFIFYISSSVPYILSNKRHMKKNGFTVHQLFQIGFNNVRCARRVCWSRYISGCSSNTFTVSQVITHNKTLNVYLHITWIEFYCIKTLHQFMYSRDRKLNWPIWLNASNTQMYSTIHRQIQQSQANIQITFQFPPLKNLLNVIFNILQFAGISSAF